MNVEFDNHFQRKVMVVTFSEVVTITSDRDVLALRSAWLEALKSWHSPYKALVDVGNLHITPQDSNPEKITGAIERMVKFLEGLFLRKLIAFGYDSTKGHDLLPFEFVADEDVAREKVGLREGINRATAGDFRSSIQIQNHFRQHTVELSFAVPVILEAKDQIETLKSKLMNNLMQWHSKWNLLIDCANLEVAESVKNEFAGLEKTFRGFFMKSWIGYAPRSQSESYPFKTFRSRHNAVARLESEGLFSGDSAQCRTGVPKNSEGG